MAGTYGGVMPLLLQPTLPDPRGPISMSVIELLAERAPLRYLARVETSLADADPAAPMTQRGGPPSGAMGRSCSQHSDPGSNE